MDQHEEKISALLLDNRFIDWVVNPQSPYAAYWLQWMAENEANAALAEEARVFLLDMRLAEEHAPEAIPEGQLEQMLGNIKREAAKERRPRFPYWMAAAVMTGVLALAAWFLFSGPKPSAAAGKQKHFAEVVRYNGNNEDELLFLPDGSKVILGKGARISYNLLMSGNKREITLTGDAFFDVAKNPQKPFYIYTKNVVVKVLGTSFKVTASGNTESVAVKTGKVSVYLKGQDLEQSAAKIVLPQQVCTYSGQRHELVTVAYTGTPMQEKELKKPAGLVFEDAPLAAVFNTLEKMYAIPVKFDEDTFNDCYITITLGDESLEEILKVITKTVDASYSMSPYGISIDGKGCRQ